MEEPLSDIRIMEFVLGETDPATSERLHALALNDAALKTRIDAARKLINSLAHPTQRTAIFDVPHDVLTRLKSLMPASVAGEAPTPSTATSSFARLARLVYDSLQTTGLTPGFRGQSVSQRLSFSLEPVTIDVRIEPCDPLDADAAAGMTLVMGRIRGAQSIQSAAFYREDGSSTSFTADAQGYFETRLEAGRWSIGATIDGAELRTPSFEYGSSQ